MVPSNDKDYLSANHMDFDLSDTDTQPPDDLQSPGGEVEKQNYDKNELQNIDDTVTMNYIIEWGDEFDTQVLDADEDIPVMDTGNETQVVVDEDIHIMDTVNETQVVTDEVMDIGNETRVVADDIPFMDTTNETQVVADEPDEDIPGTDIGNETQVLGDGILDTNLFENQCLDLAGETQRVEVPDCEAYLFTQVLDDNDVAVASDGDDSDRTEVLCDNEEACDDYSMKSGDIHTSNELEKAPIKEDEASLDGEHQSGSSRSDFTTIRVESARASGLAAERMALERLKGKSLSAVRDKSSTRQQTTEHTCVADVRSSPNAVQEASRRTDKDGKNEQMNEQMNDSRLNICSSTVRKLFAEYTTDESMQPDGDMNVGELPGLENGMAGLSYVNSQEPGELSQANALEFVDNLLKFNISENDKNVEIRNPNVSNPNAISSVVGTSRLAKTALPRTPLGEKAIFDWDDSREDEGGGELFRKKKDMFFGNGIRKLKSLTEPRKSRNLDSREGKVIETCRPEQADQLVTNKNLKRLPRSDSRIGLGRTKGSVNSSKLNKDLDRQFIAASGDKVLDTSTMENEAYLLNVGPDTQIAAEAMETLGIVTGNDLSALGDPQVVRRQSRRTKSSVVSSREATSSQCENDKHSSEPRRAKSNKARRMVTGKCSEDDGGNSNNASSAIFVEVKEKRISKRNIDSINGGHISDTREKRECRLQEPFGSLTPVARRTRQQQKVNQINPFGKDTVHSSKETKDFAGIAPRKRSRRDARPSESCLTPVEACDEQFDPGSSGTCGLLKIDAVEHPRGRRTRRKVQHNGEESGTGYNTRSGRLRGGSTSAVKGVTNVGSAKDNDREVKEAANGAKTSVRVDSSPRNGCNPSSIACTTPNNCRTPVNDASPICMGDEYHKQSCRARLSRSPLVKELNSLIMSGAKTMTPDSRRRRDMSDVRVLFSHHLDVDIIRQQKKVLLRLGASEVSSMSEATHFITDQFVRTRNMLEAIALGKPVVTHSWLQSCGQASCLIDEKKFILRDARKEKEIGFSMPVSVARASQHPLLQGQRVLMTPNTKPGKEILASLVKAVHGLAIERLGRSALKSEKLPDDLLILSCEEDYEICIPFLEKGAAVYSSELLLNGIVTQKLEHDRHRLFSDAVKRTRSKIWVKKKSN